MAIPSLQDIDPYSLASLCIQEVSLYLTSLNQVRTEPLVKFTIPALATSWNKLGLMVRGANVKLFINCQHVETLSVSRPQVNVVCVLS